MKTKMIILFIGLFLISAVLFSATQTETHSTPDSGMGISTKPVFRRMVIEDASDGDANDFTETLDPIYGYLDRIVIDSNGTDTDYDVILKDENGVTLFSKLDCSSASEPYSFILSEVDVDDNAFPGIPVFGACTLEIANIDDATADAITITIYYLGYYL